MEMVTLQDLVSGDAENRRTQTRNYDLPRHGMVAPSVFRRNLDKVRHVNKSVVTKSKPRGISPSTALLSSTFYITPIVSTAKTAMNVSKTKSNYESRPMRQTAY